MCKIETMAIDYSGSLMYKKVEGEPCPFCGCEEIRSYTFAQAGGLTVNVECTRCPAQMPSDNVQAALERWNTRNYLGIQRMRAHMKQIEWERDHAVSKLERAQLIIDLKIGGDMKQEIAEAISVLKAQGVEVVVDPSGIHADVYVATVPNGDQYEFLAAGILKLKTEGKLTVAGFTESSKRR